MSEAAATLGRAGAFGAFERMVAMRYLRSRKQEGFVSVIAGFSLLGIALGVATLIIVMAVMNGFRSELLGRIIGLNGHINVYGFAGPLEDWQMLAERIGGLEGVTGVRPSVETQGLASVGDYATGVVIRGLRPEDFGSKPVLGTSLIAGDLAAFEAGEIAMGARLARRLGLGVGDELTLISPRTSPGPFGAMPRLARYQIGALFDVGMFEYDDNFIFLTLDQAQKFAALDQGVTTLEVTVTDPDDGLRAMREAVGDEVGFRGRVLDWQQINSSFFAALQVERNVMFLILTLIILVAAFNVISSLIMLVGEKGREIAILRTMGTPRAAILRIFVLTGSSVGIVGTLVGVALGVAFCTNIDGIRQALESLSGTELWSPEIRFLSEIPAEMDTAEVVAVVGMALFLSLAATIYPALRAARLDPVEALRHG